MKPIARINTQPEEDYKVRRVDVYKQAVYDDVDLLTYKWMEASPLENPQQKNAVASDTTEKLDGRIVARLVAFREAKLRRHIEYALLDEKDMYASDVIPIMDDFFLFMLKLDPEFNEGLLDSLAEYFHRFIVWGALYDWYGSIGMDKQAEFYKKGLDDIEDEITNALRTPSIAKRPMQPFGPARFPD